MRPELLVPAGNPEVLAIACAYGADAVYIGGDAYGLRAGAKNFTPEQMRAGIFHAHECGVRVYVTVNIYARDADLPGVRTYLEELRDMRPDALIIADPGIFALAAEICPEIPRHISTQANTTNAASCRFWHAQGATRIVTARELSLAELTALRKEIPEELELEVFVHGAMCIAHSGRCLMSNYFTGRDANRGACTHPCRWKYAVAEETRPGEYMPIEETQRGTFLFNSRDLCMVDHVRELIDAGIDSFKIEGRMKTALYVATVTRAYRRAIDDCLADPARYEVHIPDYKKEVASGTHREFTTGFFFGTPTDKDQIYDRGTYVTTYRYLGFVERIDAAGLPVITQRNKFCVGDVIELMRPDGTDETVQVRAMYRADGTPVDACPHAGEEIHLDLGVACAPYDVLRVSEKDT